MIDKNVVKKLVEEWLQDKEYFLVSIEISPDDRIVVEIDHNNLPFKRPWPTLGNGLFFPLFVI